MGSKTKKIYLASGNEQRLAWQLAVNISAKHPNWLGAFYLTETTKLHSQKSIWLAGGVEENYEWGLITNASAEQEEYRGNFYFK